MESLFVELCGWLPAIILPSATLLQLLKIVSAKSAAGVSSLSWLLFGIANLGAYVYTQKYFAPQSLIGFLGSAALDFVIVMMVLKINREQAARIG